MLKMQENTQRERQFICPCGKSYFSYAALFTHIKQKHEGKPPGQIIKPKPENKRGRPRKKLIGLGQNLSMPNLPYQRRENRSGETGLFSQFNSNTNLIQKPFLLKSTPGSKFKCYQDDNAHIPTTLELPSPHLYDTELLGDLSRNLQIKLLKPVPDSLIEQFDASKYLTGKEEGGSIALCMRCFLGFSKKGLKDETQSQLLLLMSMLLQHIIQEQKQQSVFQLQTGSIHKHIISFFQYVTQKSKDTDLSQYDIFNSLCTIKALIVFFNWLNRFEAHPTLQEQEIQEQEQISLQPSQQINA